MNSNKPKPQKPSREESTALSLNKKSLEKLLKSSKKPMPSYLPVAIVLNQKGHKVHSICSSQTVFEGLEALAEKNIGAAP